MPSQDIVLGLYYMTRERAFANGEGRKFSNFEEVRIAYDQRDDAGEVCHAPSQASRDATAPSWSRRRSAACSSTRSARAEIPFDEVNKVMKKKELGGLIDIAYRRAGNKATVIFADH